MEAVAIIVAAGAGLRMQTATRKQYIMLEGRPVLAYSIRLFLDHPAVKTVIVVIPPGDKYAVTALLEGHCPLERVRFIEGGTARRESVSCGLQALNDRKRERLVCIHDAARPLVSTDLLNRLLAAAECWGAAVPVIAPSDTVKSVDPEGFVRQTLSRDELRLVQTPQVFRQSLILKAYDEIADQAQEATDDATLVELAGVKVITVTGEPANLKLTTPRDLLLASLLLKGEKSV